jgi:hypothetical protein
VKIHSINGTVRPSALFRVIATGYALGVIAIFGPLFALIAVFTLFGFPVEGPKWHVLMFPLLLPLIAVMQAFIFGGIVLLGLTVYRWYGRIQIFDSEATRSDKTL